MFYTYGAPQCILSDHGREFIKSSFKVERLTFQRMRQHMEESSDYFVSRLNNQANLCKFREREERIVEQLKYGTILAEVQVLLVQDATSSKRIVYITVYDASEGHQLTWVTLVLGERRHVFESSDCDFVKGAFCVAVISTEYGQYLERYSHVWEHAAVMPIMCEVRLLVDVVAISGVNVHIVIC